MFKRITAFFTASLFIFLCGCGVMEKNGPAPKLVISSGDTAIPCTVLLNSWEGTVYDREDGLLTYAKQKKRFVSLPLGATIQLHFAPQDVPEKCMLYDLIVDEDGSPLYIEKETREIPLTFSDGTAQVELSYHPAAILSSRAETYEPGGVLRGFRLVASWGQNECEYTFIVRTDVQVTLPASTGVQETM